MPTSRITRCSGRIERGLDERFVDPGRLVDLGCGAGRHAIRFARRGFSVTAVDLSRPMLQMVGQGGEPRGSTWFEVQANLCRLGCFPDESLRLCPVDVQHTGNDSRPGVAASRSPKPGASCGRAAGSRFTSIISG